MIETEAKFTIPDVKTLHALKKLTQVGQFRLEPTGTKRVSDRYLDTPDRDFLKAGYAFRLRTVGSKQWATLKSLTPAANAIHRRQEFEAEVNSDDSRSWPASPVKEMVLNISKGAEFAPLFIIEQQRHKYHTYLANRPVLEFSLDEVQIHKNGQVDFLELEAEVIETGTQEDLQLFIEALQAHWPLQPENRSKFERAYQAKFNTEPGPTTEIG